EQEQTAPVLESSPTPEGSATVESAEVAQAEQALSPQSSTLAADLSPVGMRTRWVLICFALTLSVYVALIPQLLVFSNPPTGDQVFYLMDVASIAQDFDLNIKNNYDNVDETKFYQLAPKPDNYVGMN